MTASALHRLIDAPQQSGVSLASRLEAVDLYKNYGSHRAVGGVSIEVNAGEAVGLLGPNGAGKTTCFYMMTGLIAPDNGRVFLDGDDITALPLYRRARKGVGYLAQESSVFRGLTVEQNILTVLEEHEPDARRRAERLDDLLESFGIAYARKVTAASLSGGERRRLELARALAADPRFMLLDEPFAGVDPVAVGDIRRLIADLKNRGIGVLLTDHNARETLETVDRVFVICAGRVLMQGTPAEAAAHPEVRRLYLGEEFTLSDRV